MEPQTPTKAVIYCRISSVKQMTEGDCLASQETRCREYAKYKGYSVVKTFDDKAISGRMTARPGMLDMLSFLKKHKKRQRHVVIIDDISRLARGLEAHLQLRTSIGGAGGILESPSIEFGEDSDSILVENLLASVSQHQRQKNAEQTKNSMWARAINGYWCFPAPIGYRFEKKLGHGKLLMRDEPVASIMQEALEGFASGRFETQVEVKRFLDNQPDYPKDRTGQVHAERVKEMLTRPIYTGYVDIPNWGVNLQEGKHEGLIDFVTYHAIQDRLKTKSYVPARIDLNKDFPLRGFVACGHCGQPCTACWSQGRQKKYPYYLCDTKGCVFDRKSIRKEKLEGDFEILLQSMKPTRNLFAMTYDVFYDLWNKRLSLSKSHITSLKQQLAKIEDKIAQFLNRLSETNNDALLTTYENHLQDLSHEKALLSEKIKGNAKPRADFKTTYRTAMAFLANPYRLWCSDKLEDKRAVLKLVFAQNLSYIKNEGYQTVKTTLPFKVLRDFKTGRELMVPPVGIEPTLPKGTGF